MELYELDISGKPIDKFPKQLKNIQMKEKGKYI
jgi:hypothetical protein